MKRLLKLVVVLLVLVVIAGVGAFFYVNSIVKQAVEYGGEYALGVNTSLDSANVALLSGNCKLNGLTIANPTGQWDTPHFFAMGGSEVAVTLGSLRSDTVEVPLIALNGISMNLERKGQDANYKAILASLKRFESKDDQTRQDESKNSKKFIVKEIRIDDVTVTADLLPLGGKLSRTTVKIPEIRLNNVGSDSDKGMLMSELADVIVKAILDAVVDNGLKLPGDMLNDLQGQLAQLEDLQEFGTQVVGDVKAQVDQVAGEAVKAIEDATKQLEGVSDEAKKIGDEAKKVGDDARKAVEGLGNLLGGDKKQDEE